MITNRFVTLSFGIAMAMNSAPRDSGAPWTPQTSLLSTDSVAHAWRNANKNEIDKAKEQDVKYKNEETVHGRSKRPALFERYRIVEQ